MTNLEIFNLARRLEQVSFSDIKSGKFQYAFMRNKSKLQKEARRIQEAVMELKPSGLTALENEIRPQVEAALSEAGKGKNGNIPQFDIDNIQAKILSKSGKADLYNKAFAEFQEAAGPFEQEESPFKFFKIPYDVIQSLPLNDVQMDILFPMIEEEFTEGN